MSFTLTITPEDLKKVFGAVKTVVSEARMHVSEEGVRITAVDATNIYMVYVEMDPSIFESYRVEKPTTIGVDIDRLHSFLKTLKDGVLEIKADDELILRNDTIEYSVSLIDPSAIRKEPKIPDLNLPARIELDPKDFLKAITTCEKISDHTTLSVENSRFVISAEGDIDRVSFSFSEFVHAESDVRSIYSLEYLVEIAKALSKFEKLNIHLGTDYPVSIQAEPPIVEFFLAPLIEAE